MTQFTKTHCTVQLHGQLFSQLCFSARPCLASLAAPGNKWNIGNTVRHVETLYKDVNVWIPLTPDLWCRSFLKTMLLSLELFHQKPVSISASWQNCPREGTTSHESNSDCIKYVKEPAGSFTKIQLSIDFHTHIWMTVWYSMMIVSDFPWKMIRYPRLPRAPPSFNREVSSDELLWLPSSGPCGTWSPHGDHGTLAVTSRRWKE